eukprot:scaffold302_cov247-Pinguiococcus_pyrenoidosus.AAC.30
MFRNDLGTAGHWTVGSASTSTSAAGVSNVFSSSRMRESNKNHCPARFCEKSGPSMSTSQSLLLARTKAKVSGTCGVSCRNTASS